MAVPDPDKPRHLTEEQMIKLIDQYRYACSYMTLVLENMNWTHPAFIGHDSDALVHHANKATSAGEQMVTIDPGIYKAFNVVATKLQRDLCKPQPRRPLPVS